jgi:hypothetical protein
MKKETDTNQDHASFQKIIRVLITLLVVTAILIVFCNIYIIVNHLI